MGAPACLYVLRKVTGLVRVNIVLEVLVGHGAVEDLDASIGLASSVQVSDCTAGQMGRETPIYAAKKCKRFVAG